MKLLNNQYKKNNNNKLKIYNKMIRKKKNLQQKLFNKIFKKSNKKRLNHEILIQLKIIMK